MTILFIYDSPLRPEAGGTERATRLVMDELERRGHHTIGLVHSNRENPDNFYLNGIPVNSLSKFLLDNHVDVVINQIAFHYWLLEDFLLHGGQEWKKDGGKVISFMHLDPTPPPKKKLSAYFDDWHQKSLIGKIKRVLFMVYLPYLEYKTYKIYKKSLLYLYENSDRYILLSESFTDRFIKLSGINDSGKLRFITNMLTFPKIEGIEILDKKEKVVLVVARLDDEQKNISFIIDVWKSLSDHYGYTLHVIGDGKDSFKLKKLAAGVDNLVFEGPQSPLNWYQRAAIFLMASMREGWGLTLTESLQCGVVPVALNTSTVFKDILSNGKNGFLARDKKEYGKYLELLMSEDSLRKTMAKEALLSAKRFSAKNVGDKWEKLLSEFNNK